MSQYRIRVRYVTHPGSNVGALLATAAGRRMRVRRDQSLNIDDQSERVAGELATRQGWHITGQRDTLEGGGYVFAAAPGVVRPCLECGRMIGEPVTVVDGRTGETLAGPSWVCSGHPPAVVRRHAGGAR